MPFHGFFPSYFVPKYKNVKKNVNGAKDEQKKVEQTILTQVVTTSVYLIWIDDDDDGGCGEGFFFFFTLLFSKENRTKNPTQDIFYMVNTRYILWILVLVVFLGPVYMEVADPR